MLRHKRAAADNDETALFNHILQLQESVVVGAIAVGDADNRRGTLPPDPGQGIDAHGRNPAGKHRHAQYDQFILSDVQAIGYGIVQQIDDGMLSLESARNLRHDGFCRSRRAETDFSYLGEVHAVPFVCGNRVRDRMSQKQGYHHNPGTVYTNPPPPSFPHRPQPHQEGDVRDTNTCGHARTVHVSIRRGKAAFE